MLDKSNFIVDRYVRGTGYDLLTGERIYSMTQMKDMNLRINIDNSVDVVDAEGSKIETIEKGISATLTGSNAFINFDLLNAQVGATYTEATGAAKLTMPKWEEFTLTAGDIANGYVTLSQTPKGTALTAIPYIYAVPGGHGNSVSYGAAGTADATHFALTIADKKITLPVNATVQVLSVGDKVFVDYEYETEDGFQIKKTASDRTKEHKFVALVLGHDICDKNTQYAAWQVFPRAKFSQEIDLSFATDADHGFTLEMAQDYCLSENILFYFLFDGNAYNA